MADFEMMDRSTESIERLLKRKGKKEGTMGPTIIDLTRGHHIIWVECKNCQFRAWGNEKATEAELDDFTAETFKRGCPECGGAEIEVNITSAEHGSQASPRSASQIKGSAIKNNHDRYTACLATLRELVQEEEFDGFTFIYDLMGNDMTFVLAVDAKNENPHRRIFSHIVPAAIYVVEDTFEQNKHRPEGHQRVLYNSIASVIHDIAKFVGEHFGLVVDTKSSIEPKAQEVH
jgi:hypothetical protein